MEEVMMKTQFSSYGKKINFDNLEVASGNRRYPGDHSQ